MKTKVTTAVLFFVLGCQVSNAQEEKRRADDGSINRELLQLIRDLRSEVDSLRKEVGELKEKVNAGSRTDRPRTDGVEEGRQRDRDRVAESDRAKRTDRPREADRPRTDNPKTNNSQTDRVLADRAPVNAAVRKTQKVFAAYDKNKDSKVSFEEWLGMREGKMTDDRRRREQAVFQTADKNKNESVSFDEFFQTRNRPARPEGRQNDRVRESSRSKDYDRARESDRKRESDRDQR